MTKTVSVEIALFGGGIAGLWLLHRLHAAGRSAVLFETAAIGSGQTYKSQGIIHGGLKYALQGVLTGGAKALSEAPALWKRCLQGQGEIDLSAVPILSKQQYLFAPSKFAAKLSAFFAGSALSSQVSGLAKEHYPSLFQTKAFKGEVYALDELVIDVHALLQTLAQANQDYIFKVDPFNADQFTFDEQGRLIEIPLSFAGQTLSVRAQHFIFTAGSGNEAITKRLAHPEMGMQKRPLHMVLAKTDLPHSLYAHCLGMGTKPRMTITTHKTLDGKMAWYLGGELAESGVNRDSKAQIAATKQELTALFPWLDFSSATFASFIIDRAEPSQKGGIKPDSVYLKTIQNMLIAWPTKLALAPRLAQEMLEALQKTATPSATIDTNILAAWPKPAIAKPIWEEAFC